MLSRPPSGAVDGCSRPSDLQARTATAQLVPDTHTPKPPVWSLPVGQLVHHVHTHVNTQASQ